MLINASKKEYTILEEDSKTPVVLDRKKADELYSVLAEKFSEISNILTDAEGTEEEIFLDDKVLSYYTLDSLNYNVLNEISEEIRTLLERLQNGKDKIPTPEDLMVLADIGFKKEWGTDHFYEKVLEDTEEKTVVEELQIKGTPLYRKRTIIWTPIKGGRESKEIIYEDLKLDKTLRKIIKNTKSK